MTFLLLAGLLSACGATDVGTDSSSSSVASSVTGGSDLPKGSFAEDAEGSFSGTVYARGYATIEEVQEPFCEVDCQTHDYVLFHVLDVGNAALREFLESNEGNAYVAEDAVGLGCVEDDAIRYVNHSDHYGRGEYRMSPELSVTILASTRQEPITLILTRKQLSGGSDAPACYSHFTIVAVWAEGQSLSAPTTPLTPVSGANPASSSFSGLE